MPQQEYIFAMYASVLRITETFFHFHLWLIFTILLSLVGIKSKDAKSRPGQTIFPPENQKKVKFPSYIRHIFEIMYKRKKIQLNKPCMSTLKNALFIQL